MNASVATLLVTALATATPALASSGIAEGFTEGFTGVFTWVFLGYCAIIVVAQTIAAFRALIGWATGRAAAAGVDDTEG